MGQRHLQGRAGERRGAGQALIGHHSQGVQIAGRGGLVSLGPFGRQVAGRADQLPAGRDLRRADGARDTEIGDLDDAARSKQQVARLDVAMDHPGGVRGLQAGRGLGHDVHGPAGFQRAAGQHGLQGRAVDQFHHQVRRLPVGRLTVVKNLRDVLMGQAAGLPRLGAEPGQHLATLRVAGVQQLDRHGPGQHGIGRAPYLAVPAVADLLLKCVTSAEYRSSQGHQRSLPPAPGFNHQGHQTILA